MTFLEEGSTRSKTLKLIAAMLVSSSSVWGVITAVMFIDDRYAHTGDVKKDYAEVILETQKSYVEVRKAINQTEQSYLRDQERMHGSLPSYQKRRLDDLRRTFEMLEQHQLKLDATAVSE